MNFSYLLLRNLIKVSGEVSIVFFTYNLKRVIKILGAKGLVELLVKLFSLILVNRIQVITL